MEALALQIIETLPPTLHRLTIDLDDDASRVRPAAGEWSTVEIVGHLVDKTRSWGERMRRIAAEENPRLLAFDQDVYVREAKYQEQSLRVLLPQLEKLLQELASDLRALPEEAWSRKGTHEERGILTLGEACRLYAISLPEHIAQLVATREVALRN